MATVFLSYAKEDSQRARQLYESLKNNGVDVWFDQESLLPGQKWKQEIEKAISDCRYFIAVMSNNSVSKKGFVQKELKIALDVLDLYPVNQIYVVPVRVEDCKIEDPKLKEIHYVDFFPDYAFGFSKLLAAITQTSDGINNTQPKPAYKDANASSSQIDAAKRFFDGVQAKREDISSREAEKAADKDNKRQKIRALIDEAGQQIAAIGAAYNDAAHKTLVRIQVSDASFEASTHRILVSFGSETHWLVRLVEYPNGIPALQLVRVHGPDDAVVSGQFNLTNDSINAVIEDNRFWLSLNSLISEEAAIEIVGNTPREKRPLEYFSQVFVTLLQRAIELTLVKQA